MRHLGSWAALIFLLNNLGLNLQRIRSHWNIRENWYHHFSSNQVQRCWWFCFVFFCLFSPTLDAIYNQVPLFLCQRTSQEPGSESWLHQQSWLCDSGYNSLSLSFLFCRIGTIRHSPCWSLSGSSGWQYISSRLCLAHGKHHCKCYGLNCISLKLICWRPNS